MSFFGIEIKTHKYCSRGREEKQKVSWMKMLHRHEFGIIFLWFFSSYLGLKNISHSIHFLFKHKTKKHSFQNLKKNRLFILFLQYHCTSAMFAGQSIDYWAWWWYEGKYFCGLLKWTTNKKFKANRRKKNIRIMQDTDTNTRNISTRSNGVIQNIAPVMSLSTKNQKKCSILSVWVLSRVLCFACIAFVLISKRINWLPIHILNGSTRDTCLSDLLYTIIKLNRICRATRLVCMRVCVQCRMHISLWNWMKAKWEIRV